MKRAKPAPHRSHTLRIGTAGWTLPRACAAHFPPDGTHLQRYAQLFNSAEINSSFHRPHQPKTWERWAASTPDGFRFSVKLPKSITHQAQLANCGALLVDFFDQVRNLGDKFGPLLIQLAPSFAFDAGLAHEFFATFREVHTGAAALEPRHASWFTPAVERVLCSFEVARVAADPPRASPVAAKPGGWPGLRYWRLHGAPRTYYSAYDESALQQLASHVRAPSQAAETWVIFDNTALGHATANALRLKELLG